MRILYLTEEAISFRDALVRGGAIHVRNVVEGLRERGHEVHLVDWNSQPERPYQHSIKPRTRFVEGPTRTVYRTISVGRKLSVDVVISKTRKTYIPGLVASRVLGVPHVVQVGSQLEGAGADLFDILNTASHAGRLRLPHDGYLVVCEAIRSQLVRRGVLPSRIFNIKNAVDASRFRAGSGKPPESLPNPMPEGPIVGYVGGLYDYKGVHDLVDAVEYAETDCTLLVAGDGPERDAMEARLDDNGAFLGAVPYHCIPGVYDLIDVLALPSHTEGLPRVLLEAAAMETPVVATDVGGVSEFVEDGVTGLLCPPRRPREFADALDTVLADETLRNSLITSASRQVTQEFSWDRMYDRYEFALSELV